MALKMKSNICCIIGSPIHKKSVARSSPNYIMKKYLPIFLLLITIPVSASSKSPFKGDSEGSLLTAILSSIETNNTQLRSFRQQSIATIADLESEITIGETSVEYSPFVQRGAKGLGSSELIVSQEFELPASYKARQHSVELQQYVLDQEYQLLRRDILLEACKLWCDLATARENAVLINKRLSTADTLLSVCNRRMQHGSATIMEENRIKVDRMELTTQHVRNDGELSRIILSLEQLGADHDLLHADNTAPSAAEAMRSLSGILGSNPTSELSVALASLQSVRQEVKLSEQSWWPKLTMGYRRNTEYGERANNGVLLGISVPLFTKKKKMKAAQMRHLASEQEMENVRHQMESRRHLLEAEAHNLKSLLLTYDITLTEKSLADLMRAVNAGVLTINDYYTEADRLYTTLQSILTTQNEYNKVLVELSVYSGL